MENQRRTCWLGQMLTYFVLWTYSLLVHGEQSDQQQDDGISERSIWQNTTDSYEFTTGYNVTEDDAHKRYIYALTFKITLALCLVSIFIVTTILVMMVIYAKYKGWKSRNVAATVPVIRTGEQSRPAPAPFPPLSQRPSFARNPMDPSV